MVSNMHGPCMSMIWCKRAILRVYRFLEYNIMLVLFKCLCFDGYEYKFNFWGELYDIKLDFSQMYGWLIIFVLGRSCQV
jgi:hypothetical protein